MEITMIYMSKVTQGFFLRHLRFHSLIVALNNVVTGLQIKVSASRKYHSLLDVA